mgnify:FL=1
MHNTNAPKVGVGNVLKYFWQALRPQKWGFFYTILATCIINIISVVVPLIYKDFFDLLVSAADKDRVARGLMIFMFYILGFRILGWILVRTSYATLNKVVALSTARIRQISFDYTIQHSYSFFANSFTGAIVQRVGRLARSVDRLYDVLVLNLIPLIISAIGSVYIVYFIEPTIAYIITIAIVVITIFSILFQKWRLKYDLLAVKADSTTSAVLSDSISNQNTVMSFAGFTKESAHFKAITTDQSSKQLFTWNLGVIKDAFISLILIALEFFVFYYAIKQWEFNLVTVGTFVLIQTYVFRLSTQLWDVGRITRNLYESFADAKEMVEILETPYEVRNLPGAGEIKVEKGIIEFKDVSFAFSDTRTVLDKINLHIKHGEKVALIGPSGAGKSTIVKLLLRMYDLASGSIEIDNQDIKHVLQDSLRKNISLVPQDPILFHRTLMENIRYGREGASDEEVVKAARLAHCDEFIDVLPLKYGTYVGERGIKLSGGERQRVAIARAILKNASILVLDEATSSLDSHSESLIQDALDKLMQGKTVIVIAHRLSTIRKMNRVVVIDNGKITEEGSHEELLNQENSLYKKLWDLQAGGFLSE